MNFFIVYLLPSILGLKLFTNFNRERKIIDLIIYYLLFVLFSNFFAMIFLAITKSGEYDLINYSSTNFVFCVKYMSIVLILNVILSILFSVISKYFIFTIEVENEKIKKRKAKSKNN